MGYCYIRNSCGVGMVVCMDRSGQPDSDHWQTPQWLYDKLDKEFHFDFDPCPLHADFDGLKVEWGKSNFVNPPYCRSQKGKAGKDDFIKKAYHEWRKGKTCVLLIPAATGTRAFHKYIYPYAEIRFLEGRIAFVAPDKPRASKATKKGKHDSMIVVFRG